MTQYIITLLYIYIYIYIYIIYKTRLYIYYIYIYIYIYIYGRVPMPFLLTCSPMAFSLLSKFEIHSRCFVKFWTITIGKDMDPFILS